MTNLHTLPPELIDMVVEELLPRRRSQHEYNINEFSQLAALRLIDPRVAESVDDCWRRFHRNGRLRLVAAITSLNFASLSTFVTNMGETNIARVNHLLLAMFRFPPLGESSFPASFWDLIQQIFQKPALRLRVHVHGDWDSRWRISTWAPVAQQAVTMAQQAAAEGISEADFKHKYDNWRVKTIEQLAQAEKAL